MTRRRWLALRGLAMCLTTLLVMTLSLGSSGWSQVARAQTVPTLTFTPVPGPTAVEPTATGLVPPDAASATPADSPTFVSASAAPSQAVASATLVPTSVAPSEAVGTSATPGAAADLAACGPGPYGLEVSVAGGPAPAALGVGGATLLAAGGLDQQSGAALVVSRFGAQVIPNDQLPAAPVGWRLLACGLQAVAKGGPSQTVGFLARGLIACLVPAPPASAGPPVRLAYFDSRPGLGRWVFLPSQETAGQICSTPFHLAATFALLSRTP